jgi:glycosyltransferase involved in cell wall biosynthesis
MNQPISISTSSMIQPALISVVLPVYNGGEYLRQSLESVLNQEFRQFEILIIDDCSKDGSFEYLQNIRDPRISLFRNEQNRGLFFNLNFLVTQSKSPLIKLWAQDDIMYVNCLGSFVDFFNKYPHIGFFYSGRDIIDEHGVIRENKKVDITPTIISTELHARIAYYTGSIAGNIANVCINRSALDKVGPFNEQMKISADFDMWVRLAKDHDTGFIREKLIKLRDHDKQLSRTENLYINHVKEDLQVYQYLDNYVTPEQKAEGHKLMRNHKLVFYYTLMLKSLLQSKVRVAHDYYVQLSKYDNFFLLSFSFLKNKILKSRDPKLFTALDG